MSSAISFRSYAAHCGFSDGFDRIYQMPSPRRAQKTKARLDYVAGYLEGFDAAQCDLVERATGRVPDEMRN